MASEFYLAAYYLTKLTPKSFGLYQGKKIPTASRCHNESYCDSWSLSIPVGTSWNDLSQVPEAFKIDSRKIQEIRKWGTDMFTQNRVGMYGGFADIEALQSYRSRFFADADSMAIGIYASSPVISIWQDILEDDEKLNSDKTIFSTTLRAEIPEDILPSKTLGFDLIEVHLQGDFCSMHCTDEVIEDITERFDLKMNQHHLIESIPNEIEVLEYLNKPEEGFWPTWVSVKVKELLI